jgi:hypothetical protein
MLGENGERRITGCREGFRQFFVFSYVRKARRWIGFSAATMKLAYLCELSRIIQVVAIKSLQTTN